MVFFFKRLNALIKGCVFVADGYDECIAEKLDFRNCS